MRNLTEAQKAEVQELVQDASDSCNRVCDDAGEFTIFVERFFKLANELGIDRLVLEVANVPI